MQTIGQQQKTDLENMSEDLTSSEALEQYMVFLGSSHRTRLIKDTKIPGSISA